MNLEITLNKGKKEGTIKAELRFDGINPGSSLTEIPESQVAEATKYLYDQLSNKKKLFFWSFVKGEGIEQAVYEKITKNISEQLPYLNSQYN